MYFKQDSHCPPLLLRYCRVLLLYHAQPADGQLELDLDFSLGGVSMDWTKVQTGEPTTIAEEGAILILSECCCPMHVGEVKALVHQACTTTEGRHDRRVKRVKRQPRCLLLIAVTGLKVLASQDENIHETISC